MTPVALPRLFGREVRALHCVGVGGMGLGPLAIYLARAGYRVSGEDDGLTEEMRGQLAIAGVSVGPMPLTCDLVAYSSAIASSHPAYVAAVQRGLPLVRRGELLAEATRHKKLVAVCGSHGKTTTTAMLVTALRRARVSAGYVLGGLFADDTPPAAAGSTDWVVAEIDESDGTIERFSPEITVAVNLDWDHPDHYRQQADIEAAFAALFERTRAAVVYAAGCAMSNQVVRAVAGGAAAGAVKTFASFGPEADFSGQIVAEQSTDTTLQLGGLFFAQTARVRARGAFNASNALAALAAVQLMGYPPPADALAAYPSVRRRQGVLHAGAFTVIEDYAHHPAEIRALLGSLRARVGKGRLWAVFQPHRFSRTAQFKGEFATALALADGVFLLEVYSAGEAPVAGGMTADVAAQLAVLAADKPTHFVPGNDRAVFGALGATITAGDLVAIIGAGDIDKQARAWLSEHGAAQRSAQAWDDFVADLLPRLSDKSRLKREEPLASKTTMRVGGAARVYAEPASLADLQLLLREAATRRIPVFPLGRGSNLIVPDAGVDGLVVALTQEAWTTFEPRPDGSVWVGAGLRLKNLCGLAAKAGLTGFEFLEGIPASLGGALRMNAGAMGGWTFDVVQEVQLVTLAGELRTLPKSAMHVDYRHCAELHEAIATGALLRPAAQADAEAVKRQMDAYARKRHETQPREPSAGCIFKNPPGTSAGKLIDECGLKGERVGDAEVSPVHANFIVNRGSATSADILALIRRIRSRVREAKGVDLQPEALLYGQRWEDVL